MNINPDNTTFICPINDAESFTIHKILIDLGYDVKVSQQGTWFSPLDKEPESTFNDLKQNIVIIEMPGPEKEKQLSKKHNVIIIDHHSYPSYFGIERENKKSSIEQVANLINYELNRDEIAVSINDQKYIYGLIDEGFSEEEIQKVRKLDLKSQGYTEKELSISENDLKSCKILPNGTFQYESSIPKYSYLIDLHVMKQKGKFSNVVVLGDSDLEKKRFIFFSGTVKIIKQLLELGGYSKIGTEDYGLWGGYKEGKEKVDINKAMKIISTYE